MRTVMIMWFCLAFKMTFTDASTMTAASNSQPDVTTADAGTFMTVNAGASTAVAAGASTAVAAGASTKPIGPAAEAAGPSVQPAGPSTAVAAGITSPAHHSAGKVTQQGTTTGPWIVCRSTKQMPAVGEESRIVSEVVLAFVIIFGIYVALLLGAYFIQLLLLVNARANAAKNM